MSQKGWLYRGKQWEHADLLAYAEMYPADLPYTVAMLNGMFQGEERPFVSPTMISGCPRQMVLRNHTDYYEHLQHAWTRYRGTIAHLVMENGEQAPDAVVEQRLEIAVEVAPGEFVTLKGKPDLIIPSLDLLVDFKSVDEIKAEVKSSWTAQLSVYRWMYYTQAGHLLTRAIIQQIGMKEPARLDVPLWDLETTYEYILARLRKFKGLFNGEYNLDNLPPPLDFTTEGLEGQRFWLCNWDNKEGRLPWCPVHQTCKDLWKKGR